MSKKLPPIPTVSQLLKMYQINAKKQMSQNFLLDMNVNRRLVKAAGELDNRYVCEVGPGPGGITRAILEKNVAGLVCIEKDPRFIPSLKILAQSTDKKMNVIYGDILNFDMSSAFPKSQSRHWEDSSPQLSIIGNLPFNVSTPLIIKWMEDIYHKRGAFSFGRTKMLLTFQKEVADRIISPTNKDERGRISVMCQNYCFINHKFDIQGRTFVPPPKVDAGVLLFIPRKQPVIKSPFKVVEKVSRHVFHYRRKYIIYGLRTLFPPALDHLAVEMLFRADVDGQWRSFNLSLEDLERLCSAYEFYCDQHPDLFSYDYRSQEALEERKKHREMLSGKSISETDQRSESECNDLIHRENKMDITMERKNS